MSDPVDYHPLSLVDLFRLGNISVYEYDDDVLLAASDGSDKRLVHLYENEIGGRTMYALNIGGVIYIAQKPFFVGVPSAVEVSSVEGNTAWDFLSMTLTDSDGFLLKLLRNDDSFPEPTLFRAK